MSCGEMLFHHTYSVPSDSLFKRATLRQEMEGAGMWKWRGEDGEGREEEGRREGREREGMEEGRG